MIFVEDVVDEDIANEEKEVVEGIMDQQKR